MSTSELLNQNQSDNATSTNLASDLVVTSKTVMAEGVISLTLAHPERERLAPWTPGAHIDLFLPNGLIRQYSLCGDRWNNYEYRISVLREPESKGGSEYIHDSLNVGDSVGLGGPRNHFHLVPATEYVFIAGGIGITPILPMIQQAEIQGIPWTLRYGGRARSSMAYLDQLKEYGEKVMIFAEDEVGFIDFSPVRQPNEAGSRVYCCGPAGLLNAVTNLGQEWPEFAIRTERFVAAELKAPTRTEAFEVELNRSGKSFTLMPGNSLLDAVRANGAEVISSCTAGTCGTCEVGVLAGVPDHRDSVLSVQERACNDRMLLCVSSASSDKLVLDL